MATQSEAVTKIAQDILKQGIGPEQNLPGSSNYISDNDLQKIAEAKGTPGPQGIEMFETQMAGTSRPIITTQLQQGKIGESFKPSEDVTRVEHQGSHRLSDYVSQVRDQLQRIERVVVELANKPDLSQQDLMRIQYEVMQMSIVLDVASKVGDKGSQAVQTLFRDK
jgi:hypothetical protein